MLVVCLHCAAILAGPAEVAIRPRLPLDRGLQGLPGGQAAAGRPAGAVQGVPSQPGCAGHRTLRSHMCVHPLIALSPRGACTCLELLLSQPVSLVKVGLYAGTLVIIRLTGGHA